MPPKKRPMSAALKAKLAHEGIYSEGLTKKPSLRYCKNCRAPLLAAIHPHISNRFIFLDAFPISAVGEFWARLYGHDTWRWHTDRSVSFRLYPDILARRADDCWVLANHVCGRTHHHRDERPPWLPVIHTPTTGAPPF